MDRVLAKHLFFFLEKTQSFWKCFLWTVFGEFYLKKLESYRTQANMYQSRETRKFPHAVYIFLLLLTELFSGAIAPKSTTLSPQIVFVLCSIAAIR